MYYDIEIEDEILDDSNNAGCNAFIVKLKDFLDSIAKYKQVYNNELSTYWKPEYEKLEKELQAILDLCDFNWLDAKKELEKYPCVNFDNFSQYVFNTDLKNMKHIKGTSIRAKTLRRKRSNKCPKCKIECGVTNDINILKCPLCGYEIMKDKSGIPDNMINNEKYMRKQLDKLIGITKLPNDIKKILPYLIIWLTDWKHIRNWLLYSRRYDDFIDHYIKRNNHYLTFDDFDKVYERIEKNKMNFITYELFIEEFYKMTEVCQTISRKQAGLPLNDDEIIDMVGKYLKHIKRKSFRGIQDVPNEGYMFEYKNNKYNLGTYLNKLLLLVTYDEHNIKYKIVNSFCHDKKDCLIFPGLLFNFSELFSLKDNIPRSFNYSENYNKIMNEVFHSQFISIPQCDIDKIINILLRYNDYYKKNVAKIGKKKETKTNSPLFVCSIKCIITDFRYFHKYVGILEQTPHRITESNTKNEIDRLWHKFITSSENKDLLELYDNPIINQEEQEIITFLKPEDEKETPGEIIGKHKKDNTDEENEQETINYFEYNLPKDNSDDEIEQENYNDNELNGLLDSDEEIM